MSELFNKPVHVECPKCNELYSFPRIPVVQSRQVGGPDEAVIRPSSIMMCTACFGDLTPTVYQESGLSYGDCMEQADYKALITT